MQSLAAKLLRQETGHVSLIAAKAPQAKVLWINPLYQLYDASVFGLSLSGDEYRDHILKVCGFVVSGASGSEGDCPVIHVDRYGGNGVGANGGSGRAGILDAYCVKGVGRTPLVGCRADPVHSSGSLFLEECLRETIYSEVVSAEFPCFSVPTLAIVQYEGVDIWDSPSRRIVERKCLMVRPAFIRPAHFMRAPAFFSGNLKEGWLDRERVCRTFAALTALEDSNYFPAKVTSLYKRWASQLAYSFTHRLALGGVSPSNITLDGRSVDFGGATSLSSLAQVSTENPGIETGNEIFAMVQELGKLWAQACKYGPYAGLEASHSTNAVTAVEEYARTVQVEMLRLSGLTRKQSLLLLSGPAAPATQRALSIALSHYRQEHLTAFDGLIEPRIQWDFASLWSESPPWHLNELNIQLRRAHVDLQIQEPIEVWARRCKFRSQTRTSLYRDDLRWRLYDAIDEFYAGVVRSVADIIDSEVLRARRDSKSEPENYFDVGFASGPGISYVIKQRLGSERLYAFLEECSPSRTVESGSKPVLIEALEAGCCELSNGIRLACSLHVDAGR